MLNPNHNEDPDRRTGFGDALALLRKAFGFLFIASYFLIWDKKTWLRDRLRLSSWAVISLSTVLLVAKFLIESDSLRTLITASTSVPVPHFPVFIVVPFLLYLLYHDIKESQKPAHEYRFARRVGQFMLGRPLAVPGSVSHIEAGIERALEIFPKIFEAELPDWLSRKVSEPDCIRLFRALGQIYLVSRRRRFRFYLCSFYVLNPTALGTKPYYFSQAPTDPGYDFRLVEGEGVAGRVAHDQVVRYVPRLFFPFCPRRSWSPFLFFPHAVLRTFEPRKKENGGSLILSSKGLDLFAFKPPEQKSIPFRSIVSVPVKSDKEVFGVMNFDFRRYDPLDVSDIAMCAAFGLLLGDEIDRLTTSISS